MANFITTSLTYEGKQNTDILIKPLFIGKSPMETEGVRIMPNVTSKTKLNYFGPVNKVLKAYSKGFSGKTGAAYTQRDIDVAQMKAEYSQDANEFYQTVLETLLGKGVDWNDLDKADMKLKEVIIEMFMQGFKSDTFRQFWLNNTYKETVTSGTETGTADTDYNAYKGMWQHIFENAAASPTADQIKAVDIDNGAVKQVDTVTLTGTSGTCNVTFNGVAYLATFTTDLTTTTANFVTSHAAALLLRGVVVTSSTDTIIFTSAVPGNPFAAVTISAAVSGNLTGTRAATTANTAPSDLAADEILGKLDTMYLAQPAELRQMKKDQKVILMDFQSYDNYEKSIRGHGSSVLWTTEKGREDFIAGNQTLRYKGIPVMQIDWDVFLEADFPHASGSNPARNNRIIITALNNLVLAMDAFSSFSKFEFWYNKDEQENRYRMQMKMGANYVHNKLMIVAYEI